MIGWNQFRAVKCFGDGYVAIQLPGGGWMHRVAVRQLMEGEQLVGQYLMITGGKLGIVVEMEKINAADGAPGR